MVHVPARNSLSLSPNMPCPQAFPNCRPIAPRSPMMPSVLPPSFAPVWDWTATWPLARHRRSVDGHFYAGPSPPPKGEHIGMLGNRTQPALSYNTGFFFTVGLPWRAPLARECPFPVLSVFSGAPHNEQHLHFAGRPFKNAGREFGGGANI